jgi:hypothetical protein
MHGKASESAVYLAPLSVQSQAAPHGGGAQRLGANVIPAPLRGAGQQGVGGPARFSRRCRPRPFAPAPTGRGQDRPGVGANAV